MRDLESLDTKSYIEHHPVFGYQYTAGFDAVLPRPGGGTYAVKINRQGIRGDREYEPNKAQTVVRMVVCGDSMAAGQFVSNQLRFSEILERRTSNLEVINLALEGSGTDQQLLIFEAFAEHFQFDIVVLLPFLQNARRNMVEYRLAIDKATGRRILQPKPRFELVGNALQLRNVPVPTTRPDVADAGARALLTDVDHSTRARLKSRLNQSAFVQQSKRLAYQIIRWEPFPEYRNAHSQEWQLMEALVQRFKVAVGDKPLLIAPVFYSSYVRYSMARNYWRRYASLSRFPGIHPIDLLPYFKKLGAEAVRCFMDPYDFHFSPQGHMVVADALATECSRLGLIGRVAAG